MTRALQRPFHRLPVRARATVCRWILLPVGRLQMHIARRGWLKWMCAPLFLLTIPRHDDPRVMLTVIFDFWSAPVTRTHSSEEVYVWFGEAGLEDIRIRPSPVSVAGVRPC